MELEYIDDNRQYDNYKKDIVTKIAYLILDKRLLLV